jgi:hypothetical protein
MFAGPESMITCSLGGNAANDEMAVIESHSALPPTGVTNVLVAVVTYNPGMDLETNLRALRGRRSR